MRVKQLLYLVSNHAAGGLVNGRFPDGDTDTGKGDCTDTFAGQELYPGLGGQGNGGKDRVAIRDIGIISCIFDNSAGTVCVGENS